MKSARPSAPSAAPLVRGDASDPNAPDAFLGDDTHVWAYLLSRSVAKSALFAVSILIFRQAPELETLTMPLLPTSMAMVTAAETAARLKIFSNMKDAETMATTRVTTPISLFEARVTLPGVGIEGLRLLASAASTTQLPSKSPSSSTSFVPPPFTFGPYSGYYYDSASGYHYHAQTRVYYHQQTRAYYRFDEATRQYTVVSAAAGANPNAGGDANASASGSGEAAAAAAAGASDGEKKKGTAVFSFDACCCLHCNFSSVIYFFAMAISSGNNSQFLRTDCALLCL
jgi:hypothetical protein